MVAVYCATIGPSGLREVAELSYHKAHYMASAIDALPGWSVANSSGETFFNEFPVKCPIAPSEVNRQLADLGIIGGLDVSDVVPDGMLFCATEMNSREDIDRLVYALSMIGNGGTA